MSSHQQVNIETLPRTENLDLNTDIYLIIPPSQPPASDPAMTRIVTTSASIQPLPTDHTKSTMTSQTPLAPRASRDSKVPSNNAKEAAITMSDLQEQIRHLRASVEDLASSSGSSKPDRNSPDASPDTLSSTTTESGSSTPSETSLPCIDELEDKVSYLYTISGSSGNHRVFGCNHCAPGEILTSEELLEEMQRKISNMAERGQKAVQGWIEAQQQLHLLKKQHHQFTQTISSKAQKYRVAEANSRQLVVKAEKEKTLAEQTMSSNYQRSKAIEFDLRQQALKAEKVKNLAEQVNADMLAHWNTSLWEVATLKARVQHLESQMELEKNVRRTVEGDATALRNQAEAAEQSATCRIASIEQQDSVLLAARNELQGQVERDNVARMAAEDTTNTLTQELSDQQDILYATRKHLEAQIKREIDARITAERESETLLARVREATAQSRNYLDSNRRLSAEILELTHEKEQLVAVDLAGVQRHCDALQAARNDDAMRMDALEGRNAYLEERLSVYEETRWTVSADTEALSDTMSIPSRGQSQGWGFGSLRGLRRRGGDEERVSLEDLV